MNRHLPFDIEIFYDPHIAPWVWGIRLYQVGKEGVQIILLPPFLHSITCPRCVTLILPALALNGGRR